MKIVLGMILKNEEYFLSRILPLISHHFDEIVAVDAESTDSTRDILAKFKAKIVTRPWTNHYADARNAVIANSKGDWMFMLDGDEALLSQHIETIKSRLLEEKRDFHIQLPRMEFVQDFSHVDTSCYPDRQGRIFRLGKGYEYRNKLHEILYRKGEGPSEYELKKWVAYDDCVIYHYGQCKPQEQVWLRHHNYGLLQKGEALLKEIPVGVKMKPRTGLKEFSANHPLKGCDR